MKKSILFIVFLLLAQTGWGQKISILGDSYSTFYGHVPEGNACWYSAQTDTSYTDVSHVEQTWWWQLVENGGYQLEVNDSYSGSTVSFYGYNHEDYCDRSFITRLPRLGNPDILLIFGCINDSWTGVEVGAYKYTDISRPDLYTYRPALAWLLSYTRILYPEAEVYYIIGDELREDITESTKVICDHYGIPWVQLEGIEKKAGHPTIHGMRQIAEQVEALLPKVRVARYLGDRTCAVSLTFDDGVREHYSVVCPQLNKYGLKGTFAINGAFIGRRNDEFAPRMTWNEVRALPRDGHEISNHGWKHINLWDASLEEAREDIRKNDEAILHEVGYRPKTYIFPFNGYREETLAEAMQGRVCCRLWQLPLGQVESGATAESIKAWLDEQISHRQWGITMTHGISVKSWDLWKKPEVLWDFFKRLSEMTDSVWTATLSDVGAYIKERDSVRIDVRQDGNQLIVVPSVSLDKELFNMPLTLCVKGACGRKAIAATQDGKTLPVIRENGRTILDFDPYGGTIEIILEEK